MSVPYTRISLLSARRASRSYTDQISCTSSVNTRTNFVCRTHVPRVIWMPVSCMSSSKTIYSSLLASQVYSPYSKLKDSKPIVNTQISSFVASYV